MFHKKRAFNAGRCARSRKGLACLPGSGELIGDDLASYGRAKPGQRREVLAGGLVGLRQCYRHARHAAGRTSSPPSSL
jgi:hypothetical protein